MAIDGWAALPEALARRLARRAMREAGLERDVRRVHLERMLDFLRRGRSVGVELERRASAEIDALEVEKPSKSIDFPL